MLGSIGFRRPVAAPADVEAWITEIENDGITGNDDKRTDRNPPMPAYDDLRSDVGFRETANSD
jgi:hypothetical protein